MVFFLPHNVPAHPFFVHRAAGTGIVASSPSGKERELVRMSTQEFPCREFQVMHERRHRHCGWQRDQDVDVVGHAVDTDQLAVMVIAESVDEGVEVAFVYFRDGRHATVRPEGDVVV